MLDLNPKSQYLNSKQILNPNSPMFQALKFGIWNLKHWNLFMILNFGFRFFLVSIFLCGCQNGRLYKDTRLLMGTFVEVVSADERAGRIVFAEIKRIEGLLSKYKEESQVSRLNKLGELKVSPDTLYVLCEAGKFWRASDGAFDVTVGPLIDLWGFTDKKYRLPDKSKIAEALKSVGFGKIIIDEKNNMVKFTVRGLKLDLGAIAKGYAVDCAVKKIKQAGINSCLINAGGDIYCLGDKFGRPWRVAVRNPLGNKCSGYLQLKDKAVATSGNYEQYFISKGRLYSHIFNPQTGYPVDSDVVSVTVIAPDCLTADALATSIFVLGKEKGLKLAKNFPNIEVKVIERNCNK